MEEKNKLREKALKKREGFHDKKNSQLVVRRLELILNELEEGSVIASYKAFRSEPSLESLEKKYQNFRWAYPVMLGMGNMNFYIPDPKKGDFVSHKWGVMEPDPSRSEKIHDASELALALIPGVVFDQNGHRYGYGKGYYDRYFQDYCGKKVGICYSCQMVDMALDIEEHDVKMDLIATEKYLLKIL